MRYKDRIVTTKLIQEIYIKSGVFGVRNFLEDPDRIILENSLADKVKKYLKNNEIDLVEAELLNMTNKFKL